MGQLIDVRGALTMIPWLFYMVIVSIIIIAGIIIYTRRRT
jgi:hypothetical protein